MEPQSDNLRERLLANLPQPGNLAQYREETATLLAKHERALFWEKWTAHTISFCGLVVMALYFWITKGRGMASGADPYLYWIALFFMLLAGIFGLSAAIHASQIATLKELKQVQLQILELQASLQREAQPPSAQ